MILSINKYEWKRVKINNVEHVLPDETTYWFETGIRRSIKMIPIWTTWQKEQDNKSEEIWKYVFILVYLNFECSVEKITVQVSDIERLFMYSKENDYNPMISYLEDKLQDRTKEQFDTDFETAISQLKENE